MGTALRSAIAGLGVLAAVPLFAADTAGSPRLRSESDLVVVGATVVDRAGHFVRDLYKKDFELRERGIAQTIRSFDVEDASISAAIVFDASSSMSKVLPMAQRAIREFIETSNPADEFSVVAVHSRPELSLEFTRNCDAVVSHLTGSTAGGQTALLDAIYLAAGYLNKGHNSRRMLLVISDGEDNNSRYTEEEVLDVLRETDATLYSIGVGIRLTMPGDEEKAGDDLLTELAESTGGRYFQADRPRDLPPIMSRLDIRYQYVLGYSPEPLHRDGKYHPIELKLSKEVRKRHLRAYCRPGYNSPRN